MITVHSDDIECIVTATDEDDAEQKFLGNEIDEWLSSEYEQPNMTVEEIVE